MRFFEVFSVRIPSSVSIISWHVIEQSIILPKHLASSKAHLAGFKKQTFFRLLHWHQHLLLFQFWFKLHFLSWNVYQHLNDICIFKVFDSFFLVIKLRALRFTSSVLFLVYILSNILLKILEILLDLSEIIINSQYLS